MKDERAIGIALRTHPLTETSLIVHWLTRDQGRLATVAKGARRPASPFAGKLDLFYLARFSFARSRRSDLHTLREATLLEPHPVLRQDLQALRQAAYAARLIEHLTEPEAPVPGLFSLFQAFLDFLSRSSPGPLGLFSFELRALHEAGLAPDLAQSPLSPGSRAVLEAATRLDWNQLPTLRLSPGQCAEIDVFLHAFLQFHLERVPPSRGPALHPESSPQLKAPPASATGKTSAPPRS